MKARSRFIAAASVLLAGSAMLAVSPVTRASASVSPADCTIVPGCTVCHYTFSGEGATPAAAEANAATRNPGCGDAVLIAGPEQLSGGLWYVEYRETCINI